jgi:hypothetical protein
MLSVAEVRQALYNLRHEWYENMSPDNPFLISSPALNPQTTSKMTISQFACLFDYGQHLKRHQRLTPKSGAAHASTTPQS